MEPRNLDEVLNGYLTCAAWADAPEGSQATFPKAEREKARAQCVDFIETCGPLFDQALEQPGYNAARFGHDFWLTRCGHGAGFWDREELMIDSRANVTFFDRNGRTQAVGPGETLGDALTAIAHGTSDYISRFSGASVSQYRGRLYFD